MRAWKVKPAPRLTVRRYFGLWIGKPGQHQVNRNPRHASYPATQLLFQLLIVLRSIPDGGKIPRLCAVVTQRESLR